MAAFSLSYAQTALNKMSCPQEADILVAPDRNFKIWKQKLKNMKQTETKKVSLIVNNWQNKAFYVYTCVPKAYWTNFQTTFLVSQMSSLVMMLVK